jgi:hypothetical protein
MAYHRGEKNHSTRARRAVNHVFTIPHIKQQISMPSIMHGEELDKATRDLLGIAYSPSPSISEFIAGRV